MHWNHRLVRVDGVVVVAEVHYTDEGLPFMFSKAPIVLDDLPSVLEDLNDVLENIRSSTSMPILDAKTDLVGVPEDMALPREPAEAPSLALYLKRENPTEEHEPILLHGKKYWIRAEFCEDDFNVAMDKSVCLEGEMLLNTIPY